MGKVSVGSVPVHEHGFPGIEGLLDEAVRASEMLDQICVGLVVDGDDHVVVRLEQRVFVPQAHDREDTFDPGSRERRLETKRRETALLSDPVGACLHAWAVRSATGPSSRGRAVTVVVAVAVAAAAIMQCRTSTPSTARWQRENDGATSPPGLPADVDLVSTWNPVDGHGGSSGYAGHLCPCGCSRLRPTHTATRETGSYSEAWSACTVIVLGLSR